MASVAATNGAALHKFIHYRRGAGQRLYAVVDAARDQALFRAARDDCGLPVRWLFEPDAAPHMESVAPYVAPLEFRSKYPFPGSTFLDVWAQHLGNSAGILLLSEADPDTVHAHLFEIFRAADEQDRTYFFRFYDPRVLRIYLPTCTQAEAAQFFGPIGKILVEGERSTRMLACSAHHTGVIIDDRPLGDEPAPGSAGGGRR